MRQPHAGPQPRPGATAFDPRHRGGHNRAPVVFTGLLIAILVIAGAATVVGGGLLLAASRRRQLGSASGGEPLQLTAGGDTPLLERTMRDLRVGDVVQHDGRDYLVEGLVRYDEAGHRWLAGRLVDGRDNIWLMVGLDRADDGSMYLLNIDDDMSITGYPSELLVVDGDRYRFEKRGTATAALDGEVNALGGKSTEAGNVHRCRWWSYRTPGDERMVIEQWGDDYRVLRGRQVRATELDMMPGS